MKNIVNKILATTAVTFGLVAAGAVTANASTTSAYASQAPSYSQSYSGYGYSSSTPSYSSYSTPTYSSYNNYSSTGSTTSSASTSTTTSSAALSSSEQSYVLSQMASRTGVSASTWNTIITRESNWEPTVVNASSGAYGLFQNMHISSGDVDAQIDAAVSLYNTQGLAAWGE
ncbi:transglycosylase SLT domain-containing protein [Secundilactobacillus paracollinoides]|uniref:transglycosylase SLT domain-containing protein n=1 Tax=Secundilactobacillus paracollinoides TaxID=240427 RepID=UPI00081C1C9D|nr:transglycosylase SLT domain-containing protein [Secundilactobacillus paracollinoides]